jgi:hypothetical protein
MHTDTFHTSLALIDYLATIVPHVHMHDPALARTMRTAATAIPVHIAAGTPDRLARAYSAAVRVHVMLLIAQAWAYMPADDLADAPRRLARRAKRQRGGAKRRHNNGHGPPGRERAADGLLRRGPGVQAGGSCSEIRWKLEGSSVLTRTPRPVARACEALPEPCLEPCCPSRIPVELALRQLRLT